MHNNTDPHLSFLWLSDIHYHKNYADKNYHAVLKEYLESFKTYLKEREEDFDYILLSGDIAQNGEQGDYELFNHDILKPLQELYPNAQLLVIPGNHDVSRGHISFIKEFIEDSSTRPDFFTGNVAKFVKVFDPYTEYFKSNKKIAHNASETYRKSFLYGHVLDKKNKTIILLLNSAWYSFGHTFLEHYLSNKLYENKNVADFRKDILKITSEYGKQMLALEILEEVDAIVKLLGEYPEYLVITTMHHPVSWLHEDDQITKEGDKFHTIKGYTDLMLTGHEHVHQQHPFEYMNNNKMLHLKAGCFADFSKEYSVEEEDKNYLNPFKIRNNWFSTLKINTKKRTVGQHKHIYDPKSKTWSESEENYNLLQLNKKHKVKILDTRLQALKQSIVLNPLAAVNHLYPEAVISKNDPDIFQLGNDGIIFLRDDNIAFQSDRLKKFFSNGGECRLYVVLVDLFNNKSERYCIENKRLITANDIKNDYDFKFDAFRHNFFSNLTVTEVEQFGNLIFISKLIPFWDLEN